MNIPIIEQSRINEFLDKLRSRNEENQANVVEKVNEIIYNVRKNRDSALREYTEKFDNVSLKKFEIEIQTLKEAYRRSPISKSLERAAKNIYDYHENQKKTGFSVTKSNGTVMGQKVRGLNRVGVYVPGGTAAYPSSVLMNVIPAKVAGVKEIIMVTPPQKHGNIVSDDILAAAYIAGVDRVFSVGGAHAAAALAYGTEEIPRVDKIVGPGNIFVATAKRLLYGVVDIDMVAGPSEILIIADNNADCKYIAADMMSQAEHDVLASSIVLCFSKEKAAEIVKEVENQVQSLSRKEIIEKSLKDFGAVIICDSIEKAIDTAEDIAPEHIELMVDNPFEILGRINNAGSIFLGGNTPEPMGDYFAGPNHVLPTSGTARFFSPLSVDSFIKKSSFLYYSGQALLDASEDVIKIAEAEGLTAHANSVKIRVNNKNN